MNRNYDIYMEISFTALYLRQGGITSIPTLKRGFLVLWLQCFEPDLIEPDGTGIAVDFAKNEIHGVKSCKEYADMDKDLLSWKELEKIIGYRFTLHGKKRIMKEIGCNGIWFDGSKYKFELDYL